MGDRIKVAKEATTATEAMKEQAGSLLQRVPHFVLEEGQVRTGKKALALSVSAAAPAPIRWKPSSSPLAPGHEPAARFASARLQTPPAASSRT